MCSKIKISNMLTETFKCFLVFVASDHPYYAQSGPSGTPDSYIYYLNICGRVPTQECGDGPFISSCQVKNGEGRKIVAGQYQNQTLR